MLSAEVSIEKK